MTTAHSHRAALGLGLALGSLIFLVKWHSSEAETPPTGGSPHASHDVVSATRGAEAERPAAERRLIPGGDHATAWTGAAQARVAAAYHSDQVLVAVPSAEALDRLARAHGLAVLRSPGLAGVGALQVPPDRGLAEVMEELQAEPVVSAVMPNGKVQGAGDDAVSMQEDADKLHAKAEDKEAKAQAAEAELRALIEEGASTIDIEEAREDAAKARASADKAWKDATKAQEKADRRANLEYRAKVRGAQLHLTASNHPRYRQNFEKWDAIPEPDHSGVVVAVLDTGVAYTDTVVGDIPHVAAPSLSSSAIVAPIDLVNDDDHPGDDHQHGTHIASIIASSGDLVGLAPGVTLMPVKVLDQHNQGTELDLVEGILHAVEAGADIINLSLSFGEGYVPSPMLAAAIEQAHQAGVVMIGASGNDAAAPVTWPAASPRVVAVTSAEIDSRRKPTLAPYASTDPRVDITALGGHSSVDHDGDGFDDGILAETIAPGDPSRVGYWFYAGTSQAAAVATGSVVRLMATGLSAQDAVRVLQYSASDDLDGDPYASGWGAGVVDLGEAERLAAREDDLAKATATGDLAVSIHPYILSKNEGTEMEARATLMVVDAAGTPHRDVVVMGHVSGAQSESFSCKTDSDGLCEVKLDKVETEDEHGQAMDPGLAWIWQVDAMIDGEGISSRFTGLLYATDGLDALSGSQAQVLGDRTGALAIYWPPGTDDDELGELVESYTVLHANAGGATAPVAMALTAGLLRSAASVSDHSVTVDGSGIATSPFGLKVRLVDFDGAGLSTSPFGFTLPPLFAVDGAGLSTSPFGLHPLGITQPLEGSGLSTSPFGVAGAPVLLSSGTIIGSSETDGALASHLAAGGWGAEGGQSAAAVLAASGILGVGSDSGLQSADTVGSSTESGVQVTEPELAAGPLPVGIVE